MCFITKNTLRIADCDIKVRKLFSISSGHLKNWCQHQDVMSRELIPETFKHPDVDSKGNYVYDEGFIHAFGYNNCLMNHTHETAQEAFKIQQLVLLDCIIPKGTLFCGSQRDIMVAQKIIITDPKFDNYVFN